MKNFKWDKKYLYWGVTAFCVVLASILFFWILERWSLIMGWLDLIGSALSPFIYGILIAYLLNKAMSFFEARLFRRLAERAFRDKPVKAKKAARIFSILFVQLLALGIIAALLVIMLPQIYNSIMNLLTKSSQYIDIVVDWVERFMEGETIEPILIEWINKAADYLVSWLETDLLPQMDTLIASVTGGVMSVVTVIFNFFVGVVISIYILYNKETFSAQAKKVLFALVKPKAGNAAIREMKFINDAFGDYIVAEIIDSLIVGVINYLFMAIVGMPYVALVSILMAITNLIPIFGPFIGAIPSALLILLESPMMCLIFIIFTLVLQQIDGNVIKPRIHSTKSGISGFWIMFAILFFGGIFGIAGMVLGVPVTTVLYSLFRRVNNSRLKKRGLPENTAVYSRLESIDPETGEMQYAPEESEPEPVVKSSRARHTPNLKEVRDRLKNGGFGKKPGPGREKPGDKSADQAENPDREDDNK